MQPNLNLPSIRRSIPPIVQQAGPSANFAWEEFFYGRIRSEHTRRAYARAVCSFMAWCENKSIQLARITPAHVGIYLDELPVAIASKKQTLAGLRHFFDGMVVRHAIPLNPALSVRTERYSVMEGKTPEITIQQARRLLLSLETKHVIAIRDKCIIAILIYTAARIGAVSKLMRRDFYDAGDQHYLHFVDKGGKSRQIPVRHDLMILLTDYFRIMQTQGIDLSDNEHLFPTSSRRTGSLSSTPMSSNDIGRMVKRRMKSAGLPSRLSPHSFRVATITDLLSQGVPLEDVQNLAGHADPRTTRLYDRRQKSVTRNIVERISI